MSEQEASYDHAIGLANQGRFAEALQIADQLSQGRPEVVDFVTLRARLHFDNGDANAALAVLDEALARLDTLPLQPPHRWVSRGVIAHRYGAMLMSLSRDAEARPWLHEAAQRSGLLTGEWAAHFHAGLAALRMGDMAAAGRYWYDLMVRNPDLGADDIAPLVTDYIARAEAAGVPVEPLMRICLGRVALDNPHLLELDAAAGDTVAADQAARVLAEHPDHPEARRLRAPLRHGVGDAQGALDDLAVFLRQVPDPHTQVRELAWRHQLAQRADNAQAAQPADREPWLRFTLTDQSDDGAGYYRTAMALGEFIDEVPAAEAALRPVLVQAGRAGVARFDQYFATGQGDAAGHGGNADPHVYSLLCRLLSRSLPAGAAHADERIALHRQGMAASEFIDHWIDLLDCHADAGQHQEVAELAGEVLNRYPLERNPADVTWAFSRMIAAWKAMGGAEPTEAARAAMMHMDARLDALPVEARSEAAHPMAHARAHYAALLQARLAGMDEHDRTDTLAEIEGQQRRALLVEDAWLYNRFGQVWRDVGDSARALPLFEQAVALTEGDPLDQAGPRVQRGLVHNAARRHDAALADFVAAFAVRDDWDAEVYLRAVQSALGQEQRDTALGYFDKARARGAAQGATRTLYTEVETALKATRPMWKVWGV
ncbi:tetratricopeptide repeat protein [Cupriavidus sp. TMH.W2]|uniref:tetratricopeptide repeat protein n=1 Tax=Cupriavidus sp. TMH.W2 TaxID=3434465 RepID=UPI003D777269